MSRQPLSVVLAVALAVSILVGCESAGHGPALSGPERPARVDREETDRPGHRLPFTPYALARANSSVWVLGSHGAQRLSLKDAGRLGEPMAFEKTLLGAVSVDGEVWAVGGGDGADPHGELLRIAEAGIVERVLLEGSSPYDLEYAHGYLWVANASGQAVAVVDPKGGRVRHTENAGEFLVAVTKGLGSVWVLSSGSGSHSWGRIDPATGDVGHLVSAGKCPIDISIGAGSVWVADHCEGVVRRFSTAGKLQESISVGGKPTVTLFHDGLLWVGSKSGTLASIDPATSRIADSRRLGGSVNDLLPVAGRLWVLHGKRVTRVPFRG